MNHRWETSGACGICGWIDFHRDEPQEAISVRWQGMWAVWGKSHALLGSLADTNEGQYILLVQKKKNESQKNTVNKSIRT